MVSPYPPARDGIGAYAVQQGISLRAQGHHVEVLSPLPSAAHHHLELRGWRGPLELARLTARFDRVIVHFHVDMFYPPGFSRSVWVAVTLGLTAAFARAKQVDLIVHEIDYSWGRRTSTRRLAALMLRSATRVMVHTETERRLLCEAFALPTGAVTVLDHGADFIHRTDLKPAAARALLGVPAEDFVFLAIGFVQPHKGFDRAIQAFGDLGDRGCRLYIVGSIRVEDDEYLAHLEHLRALAAERAGVELRIEFVSDERFDAWLVAADVVVLPYRYIWSSSVLERARLYDRPVIASDVGGLRDQGYQRAVWVGDDQELEAAMHAAAARAISLDAPPPPARAPFRVDADAPRDLVLADVRLRAGRRRRPGLPTARSTAAVDPVTPLLRVSPLEPAPVELAVAVASGGEDHAEPADALANRAAPPATQRAAQRHDRGDRVAGDQGRAAAGRGQVAWTRRVRICVCGAQSLYMSGGAELLHANLVDALREAGHEVELVRLPVAWSSDNLLKSAFAWRLLTLDADLVIATNFPSYFVRHPRKVVWLVHQHRAAYDALGQPWSDLGTDDASLGVHRELVDWDSRVLAEAHGLYATSFRVAERLRRFNGLSARVVYHPPPLSGRLHSGRPGDYVFCATRLEANKRPDLLVSAMAHVRSDVRLSIAGHGSLWSQLAEQVRRLKLESRVTLLGFVDDATIVDLYAHARAVVYVPSDEDYGYVPLQAFSSSKPVVSSNDLGGVLEWVRDGETGIVVDPDPQEIAQAIDRLVVDDGWAASLGRRGADVVATLSWRAVVDSLLA